MNKNGFLLGEEKIKIILALLGIIILIYIITAFYLNTSNSNKITQAESSLNAVFEHIDIAKQEGSSILPIFVPTSWYLFTYSELDEKPKLCAADSDCICICAKKSFFNVFKNQEEVCAEKGVCKNSLDAIEKTDEIEIKELDLKIIYKNGKIKFER